jgi:hypothetical protein
LKVDHSTVGALRLATQRPDLATSEIRLFGHSHAAFDHVNFDCGVVVADSSSIVVHDSVTSPKYIRRSGGATVTTTP